MRLFRERLLARLVSRPPEKPPPETRDVVRTQVDDDGREIEVQPA